MLCALPVAAHEIPTANDVEHYLQIVRQLLADAEVRGDLRDEISAHIAALFDDPKHVVRLREWLLQPGRVGTGCPPAKPAYFA